MEIDDKRVKIMFSCPEDEAAKLRMVAGDAGGGIIGDYSHCCGVTKVEGYFKPIDGANPTIGKVGEITKVDEVIVEFQCDVDKVEKVINAIKEAHSYEEPVIEIRPLLKLT